MKWQMCRICLVENVALLPIAKSPLQEIYEKLTEMKLDTNTSRPILACYMCYARLRNCYQLKNSCLRSEEIFRQTLISNNQVLSSKPDALLKSNFLEITPFIKMNICDVLCEMDEVDTSLADANKDRIELEASLTEEIHIKMEKDDTSDCEELQDYDPNINLDGGENFSTVDDGAATKPKLITPSSELVLETEKLENLDYGEKPFKTDCRTYSGRNKIECDICNKQFELIKELKTHLRMHTSKKLHVCSFCNKQFRTKSNLGQHLRTHSKKSYKCNFCNKEFAYKYILETHFLKLIGKTSKT